MRPKFQHLFCDATGLDALDSLSALEDADGKYLRASEGGGVEGGLGSHLGFDGGAAAAAVTQSSFPLQDP